jgi:hypothetical protein
MSETKKIVKADGKTKVICHRRHEVHRGKGLHWLLRHSERKPVVRLIHCEDRLY